MNKQFKKALQEADAPDHVMQAFLRLSKHVSKTDKSGKVRWEELTVAGKPKEDQKVLYDFLYVDGQFNKETCDETNPNDPHYEDRGLGWYGQGCVWHWYM